MTSLDISKYVPSLFKNSRRPLEEWKLKFVVDFKAKGTAFEREKEDDQ